MIVFAVRHKPDLVQGGVIDAVAVGTADQRLIRLNVLVDLDIGGVPNIVFSRNGLAKALQAVPILIVFELVGMSPQIKQAGIATGEVYLFILILQMKN